MLPIKLNHVPIRNIFIRNNLRLINALLVSLNTMNKIPPMPNSNLIVVKPHIPIPVLNSFTLSLDPALQVNLPHDWSRKQILLLLDLMEKQPDILSAGDWSNTR